MTLAKTMEINYSWEKDTFKLPVSGTCSIKDGNSVQQNIVLKSRIRDNGYKVAFTRIEKLKLDDTLTIRQLMLNAPISPDQLHQWIAQNSHFDAITFKSAKVATSTIYINGAELAKFIKRSHYAWLKKNAQLAKSQPTPTLSPAEPQLTNPPGATPFKMQPQVTPAAAPGEPVVVAVPAAKPAHLKKSEPNELTLVIEVDLPQTPNVSLEERTKQATLTTFESAKAALWKELQDDTPFLGSPSYSEWTKANPDKARINWGPYFSVQRVKINDSSTKVEVQTKLDIKTAKNDIKKSANKPVPVTNKKTK
jgi:hypothetical protein